MYDTDSATVLFQWKNPSSDRAFIIYNKVQYLFFF